MICEEYYIDPFIALENQDVIKAIKNQDYNKLVEILENEF
tara:strand:- start:268 stop:387 length:120 start_codon:yes stop_codon:yes gene_type:complete